MDEVAECGQVLPCGHKCCGVAGEQNHFGCFEDGCDFCLLTDGKPVSECGEVGVVSGFQSGSDECGICLEELRDAPCLRLACSHVWHADCLRQQLQFVKMDRSKRISFTGSGCGVCQRLCEHPLLEEVLAPVLGVKRKVEALAWEQIKVDNLEQNESVAGADAPYKGKPLEYALHSYTFYFCGQCDEPFFGGAAACAETVSGEREIAPSERVCSSCDARGGAPCDLVDHRKAYIWKCRFCCSIATFVCYGGVHVCEACHSDGMEQRMSGTRACTPCDPSTCILPRRHAQLLHENGPGEHCEQVLVCSACFSNPSGSSASSQSRTRRCSPNLLRNNDGQHGLSGWQVVVNGGLGWAVERDQGGTASNFVSSSTWCVKRQVVDLKQVARAGGAIDRGEAVEIEVSSQYMARTDCESVYALRAFLLDSQGAVLDQFASEVLPAPPDSWETVSHMFEPREGVVCVVFEHGGKDSRFWRGHYGSKVTSCCVRVVYGDTESDPQSTNDAVDESKVDELRNAWLATEALPPQITASVIASNVRRFTRSFFR